MLFVFLEDNEKIQTELRELRIIYYSQKELYEDLAEKMKFFSKVSAIFWSIRNLTVMVPWWVRYA